jgi:hypothetical protein
MHRVSRLLNNERGIALVIALSIMALLLVSGVFLLRMSSIEGDSAYNTVWAEGSFYAADAAINVGLDQMNPTVSTWNPGRATIGGSLSYTPSVEFLSEQAAPGSSMCSGITYNPGCFKNYIFTLTGTGTGPRSAQRTIDAQASYGPIR